MIRNHRVAQPLLERKVNPFASHRGDNKVRCEMLNIFIPWKFDLLLARLIDGCIDMSLRLLSITGTVSELTKIDSVTPIIQKITLNMMYQAVNNQTFIICHTLLSLPEAQIDDNRTI